MRWVIGLLLVCADILPMTAAARTAVIPRAYWGEFSLDPKLCGNDDSNDEVRIWISAQRVSMYEAQREVAAVVVTTKGLRLRFKPWGKEYYGAGFNPEEGLQPPDELVLTHHGELLNGSYHRCHGKRK